MTGDLLGTMRYMSPEQALAKHGLVDHHTDIYSLGATLYELLTGRPAVEGQDRQEILKRITDEEPRLPRTRNSFIPAELETIVLKSMEKNPADRYATAKELADDLRRFLENRPIQARRPSLAQRTAKWLRRHQTLVGAACLVLLLAVAGLALSTALIWTEKNEKEQERDRAQKEYDRAEEQRLRAEGQRQKAEEATARETAQRRRADDNFRRSVAMFTELLNTAIDQQSRSPEIDQVRKTQADQVIKFLLAQLKDNRPDPEGRLLTGLAYEALSLAYLCVDDYPQAAGFLDRGLESFGKLVSEFPDDARFQEALGGVHLEVRNLMRSAVNFGNSFMNQGKYAKAVQTFRAALTFCEKHPIMDVELHRGDMARGLAHALRASGRSGEAEAYCSLAIDQEAMVIAENGKAFKVYVPLYRLNQAGAYTLRGLIRADLGRAGAEADFRQAIALIDALKPQERRVLVTLTTNQPLAHHALGNLLWAKGERAQATEQFRLAEKAWRAEPQNARSNSSLAWLLATCPDPQLHNHAEALELATKATGLPADMSANTGARPWQVLGVAHYRTGNWKAAVEALKKSRQLYEGGDASDYFFLAMANFQLVEKRKALQWYEKAVAWTEKCQPKNQELRWFRAEADELLGTKERE
jgi:tetratricopeptide (TPR) repeat protein